MGQRTRRGDTFAPVVVVVLDYDNDNDNDNDWIRSSMYF
ncbi:hypothetical protein BDD21_2789 [Thiocapsa rosea]|uniref:Uncharacterized protein n=1 Tax=Thiocapsa rosea TaxID=69360 RepID=A0A495V7T3_9GAMM|nr:hypothetical protein BDD21_2789 [Thiocapsa rosea]